MDVKKPWVTGVAFELMLRVGCGTQHRVPHEHGPVFRAGDELLVRIADREFVAVLVSEDLSDGPYLRVARKDALHSRLWGWWEYAVGWRRPT